MSSSDDSSSSSSDEAPREERPSSHSGISDEEQPSSPPLPPTAAAAALPAKKSSKKSASSSSSSSSEDEEKATRKKSKSKSKSSTPSSRSVTPKKSSAPIKSTDTMGSLSPDSSDAPEENHPSPKAAAADESNIVPDLSDDSDEDVQPKKAAKPRSSPKETAEDDEDNSDDDIVGPRLHFDPNDVEEEKEVEIPPIEYDVPLVRGNYGKEAPVLTRWPNFISIDRRPFTEDSYDPEEDINAVDGDGRSRLQLKVENCIRWRNKVDADGNIMKDEDGKEIRESNAKIVRWSDGTMTLNLGAEIYEVSEHKIEEYNQLYLRMRAGLHGNALFKKRFAFRPLTTDSMTHKKMTMQMAEKTNKSQKVKMISDVGLDPESSRAHLIRKEEERMRATMRREAQQRKAKERQYRTGLSHGFLEDRDEYDDDPESLSAIKRSYKNNRFDRFDAITRRYGHEDEDEDEYEDSRRIERSKIESDDEEDVASARKREDKKKRKIVISDEEED